MSKNKQDITSLDEIIEYSETQIHSWLPGAMFPSEVAWLLYKILEQNCTAVIELGRQDGYSTAILGEYLTHRNIKIYSIDFDHDPVRAEVSREKVKNYQVECISGDVHSETPKLLKKLNGETVCVVQDAAKGWEGLTTVLAASQLSCVKLIAQHNLHLGHRSRMLFNVLSTEPAFLDESDEFDRYKPLRHKELDVFPEKAPNRELDHTSLGIISVTDFQRKKISQSFLLLGNVYDIWNPGDVYEAWKKGDYGVVEKIKKHARFSLHRFKKR